MKQEELALRFNKCWINMDWIQMRVIYIREAHLLKWFSHVNQDQLHNKCEGTANVCRRRQTIVRWSW